MKAECFAWKIVCNAAMLADETNMFLQLESSVDSAMHWG